MGTVLPTAADLAALQSAFACVQAGDGSGATAILKGLSAAVQALPDALMVAAFAAKAQGEMTAALQYFQAATRAAPLHPGIWNSYANLLDDLGDHKAAMAAYRRALAIDPGSAATWTNLALAAIAAQMWVEADAAVAHALAIAPDDARALGASGLVAQGQGQLGDAEAAYSRALSIAPHDATLRHNMAIVLRRSGEAAAAMAVLGAPPSINSTALRGHLFADQGRFDAALADYHAVLAAEPGHLETLEALAILLPQIDRVSDTLSAFHVALKPGAMPALWRAAIAAAKGVGDADAMLGWARAAEIAHGNDPDWSLAQAGALALQGKPDEALALARQTARRFSHSAAAQNYLAWLLIKRGDIHPAERHTRRAAQLAPLDQTPWALLTLIWRLLDDRREAWLIDYDRLVIAADMATPAGWSHLGDFLGDLQTTLTNRHIMMRAPADQSLRGGTQTPGTLFESRDPVLGALRTSLIATVEAGLADLQREVGHPFLGRIGSSIEMAGSWSVRLLGQGFHISHIHHSGWLSSAFYVYVPPEIGAAASGDAGKLMFGVPDATLGIDLAPRRTVTPVPGRLVIFPSYVWHGTAPFESIEPRMTVAFDALPVG